MIGSVGQESRFSTALTRWTMIQPLFQHLRVLHFELASLDHDIMAGIMPKKMAGTMPPSVKQLIFYVWRYP